MDDNLQQFAFVRDCLNGSGGFRPNISANADGSSPSLSSTSYLVRYPREDEAKYARRQQVAHYRNFLKPACGKFAGYLTSKPPSRTVSNPLLKAVVDNADDCGNSLDVFWNAFAVQAKARGSMLLLVEMPRALPPDQGSQLAQRKVPYLVPIYPEDVVSYKVDSHARLELVAIADTDDEGKAIYRVWNTTSWWTQKPGIIGENILESGDHNLGVCPVLAFTESGVFPSLGEWYQVCELSRRYYNAASERDEILRSQTFSLLTYQQPENSAGIDVSAAAEAISTHNMLIHQGDTPAFIAPPDGPATIYADTLKDIKEDIRQLTYAIEYSGQAESGLALKLRFQDLNAALTAFACRMGDLERRVWDVVCRWLGLSEQPEIAWADSYELTVIDEEMTTLQNMQASAFPEAVVREQMKIVVRTQFANLDPDLLDTLIQAIDLKAKETPPPADSQGGTI